MAWHFTGANRTGIQRSSIPETSGSLTICGWIKHSASGGSSGDQSFARKGWLGNANRRWRCGLRNASGWRPFFEGLQGSTGGGGPYTSVQGATLINADVWYHIAGVHISGTGSRVYVGGSLDASNTSTAGINDGPENFGIANGDDSTDYFAGDVAEVGLWNTWLTANEILALSRGASPSIIRRGNLVGYWPLSSGIDVPAGTQAHNDLSGNKLLLVTQNAGSSMATGHPPIGRFVPGHG